MREVGVVDELVVVCHILPARNFLKNPSLAAGQRLQRPPELRVLDVGQVFDLRQRQGVGVVEDEQTQRLEQRHLQLFDRSFEAGLEDCVAQVGLPLELAAGVLSVVELGEDFLILHEV